MAQLPIMFKWHRDKLPLQLAEPGTPATVGAAHKMLSVRFLDLYRTKRIVSLPGLGRVGESERVGIDRSTFRISAGSFVTTTKPEPDAIRKVVRRLRPQEAETLDRIDAEIARLTQERRDVLAKAWASGHVVTAKELRERAQAEVDRVKSLKQAAAGVLQEIADA